MSDVNLAPDAGASAPAPAPEASDDVSVHEFGMELADKWRKQREAAEAPVKAAEPPAQVQAPEADSAPPQEATAETQEADPATEPPLDLPRSWSKERSELWTKLDRDTQNYLLEHDSEVSKGVRKAQNEAAEERKAALAARDAAEKARQEYENALPQLIQTVRVAQAGEFADIKTHEDAKRVAAEDWPRYVRYLAHMSEVQSLENEAKTAQENQIKRQREMWSEFAAKEDKAFLDDHPEFKDEKKRSEIAAAVLKTVEDSGGSKEDLLKAYNGELGLNGRARWVQNVFLKAALYDQAKANISKPAPKPVPPVQKPGTAQPATDAVDEEIKTLTRKVAQTGKLKDMAALQLAKMKRAANK